jgi:hypothetical protein
MGKKKKKNKYKFNKGKHEWFARGLAAFMFIFLIFYLILTFDGVK